MIRNVVLQKDAENKLEAEYTSDEVLYVLSEKRFMLTTITELMHWKTISFEQRI